MATYMTRVELHEATYNDYEILHAAMGNEGFSRTITGSDGVTYHLPTAEYYRDTQLTLAQVLESAKLAASTTRKNYGAIVTMSNGATWTGLAKV
jgi:hypothetical protein